MAKSRTIRINELAKELQVSAKSILDKIRGEGIETEKELKTSSSISVGLAETVRDWKNTGELKADEESSVAVAEKPKKAAGKGKKTKAADDASESAPALEPAVAQDATRPTRAAVADEVAATPDADSAETKAKKRAASTDESSQPPAPVAPTAVEAEPAAPVRPAVATTRSTVTIPNDRPAIKPAAVVPAPAVLAPAASQAIAPPAAPTQLPTATTSFTNSPPASPPAHTMPTTGAAAAHAAAHAAGSHSAGASATGARPAPLTRPTVSIDSLSRPASPPPRLLVPTKATLKGPNLIREEKPDVVPTPRARPRPGTTGGPGTAGSSFNTMKTRAGGGVKVSEEGPEEESADKKDPKKKGAAGLSARRKGMDGRRGQADEKLKEFTEADLIERRDRLLEAARYRSGVEQHMRKSGTQRSQAQTGAQRGGVLEIEEPVTVKSLSLALGIKANEIIGKLLKQGVFATINQSLDFLVAGTIAAEWGVELKVQKAPTLEERFLAEYQAREIDPANLVLRPPVVTILGHVDHGKTSLLDKIRQANVAAGEAGGITQHIAAFSVELDRGGAKKRVTFIDTPGHQAFTAMRARGANMTDVAVLVIDAAQGIQPQTVESINHARAAGVPIVIALNKIDLADANPDMVMGQLAQQELSPVAWGGQTEVIKTSGRTGAGIEELIEILDLQSQILELQSDPTAPARGTVIEARVDAGLGSVATVLVQDGTLKVGDVVLAGHGYGKIRQLMDSYGKFITEAGPSTPVLIAGLSQLPMAGDKFFVIESIDRAREICEEREVVSRQAELANQNKVSLENLFSTIKEGQIKTINLIVKGDVSGSVETLIKTVTDSNTEEVQVKVIHSAVGAINESDVELASASGAVIIGFHVAPEPPAQALAEARHVEIRTYRVIYEIFDDLKKALSGMLAPEIREKHHGWIEVRQTFKVSRVGTVAGCYVTEGYVSRGSKIRVVRDGKIVIEGLAMETLRRVKDDVKDVKIGFECGIKLTNFDDVKIGDKFEAYVREEIKRTL